MIRFSCHGAVNVEEVSATATSDQERQTEDFEKGKHADELIDSVSTNAMIRTVKNHWFARDSSPGLWEDP